MVDRIEILVEEPSMEEVLKGLLPGILPEGWAVDKNCFVRPHQGKQDLQRSIPRKVAAASKKDIMIGFIILQDQDSADCVELKHKLATLCDTAFVGGHAVPYKVRVVCHELEAWYLGDMSAIEKVFPRFKPAQYQNKRMFRNPDKCVNPKRELKNIVGDYSQIATAREMAQHMCPAKNKSCSFNHFVKALIQMAS